MWMPSTPFGVSAGRFTLFRVVSRSQIEHFRSSRGFCPGSIPGSSTRRAAGQPPFICRSAITVFMGGAGLGDVLSLFSTPMDTRRAVGTPAKLTKPI